MDGWNYQRKEARRHFKVYLHYHMAGYPDKYVEPAGECFAFSPEQAEHLVSMQNGDGGKRKIEYKGYTVTYEAEES